jgi:hypothetical protein
MELFITDHPPRPVKGENIKDKDPFGSVYKKNWMRGLQQLRRTPESRGADYAEIIVDTKKVSDGKEEPPFTVRVDFFEDAVTFRRKEGAVEEITSGNRIYQAYIDLKRATARKVFEHINSDANNPTVPLSTIKNKTTDLKRVELIEEVGKDGKAPIYAPVKRPDGTREDRPTEHTEDGGTVGRTLGGSPDREGEKAEETSPPSSLNNIVGDVEISEEEEEQERRQARLERPQALGKISEADAELGPSMIRLMKDKDEIRKEIRRLRRRARDEVRKYERIDVRVPDNVQAISEKYTREADAWAERLRESD